MELRHLRYFVAVAEEGSMTRAAVRLGLQQPPLSQQIRALEAEIGVPLFTRLARGVALNPAGKAFLVEAQALLEGATRAAARAVLAAGGQSGEITIGLTTSAILHPLVPQIIRRYVDAYPEVALQLTEGNAAELTEALTRDDLQVVFLRAAVAQPANIAFTELLTEDLLVAVAATHPLARRQPARVDIAALAGERFILVRRHAAPGMYAAVLDACREAGFEPQVAAEVERMLTNISLVAAGIGISLVPASMREIRIAGVKYLRLAAPPGRLRAPLTVAARSGETQPTVANLLRCASHAAAEAGSRRGRPRCADAAPVSHRPASRPEPLRAGLRRVPHQAARR